MLLTPDPVVPEPERTGPEAAGAAPHARRSPARLGLGWWLLSAAVVVLLAMFLNMLLRNPNVRWDLIGEYFTSRSVLEGLARTLQLTVIAMAVGIVLGVVLAIMRLSPIPVLRVTSWLYVWFFRGTPLFVQIIFWYNLAALVPEIRLGVPFGPTVFGPYDTNTVITAFVAAVVGLGLNEGAYMSEVVRAGLLSVDHGQGEAASALGMRRLQAMRRIIIPQALRVIVPPTGNQVISMLKATALVSVTATPELLYSVQIVYNRNFQTIPLLIVACLWYLVVTSILSLGQYYVERRFARGTRRTLPPTPLQRLRRWTRAHRRRLAEASRT